MNSVIPNCVSNCRKLEDTAGCEIFKCSAVSTVVEQRIIAAKISKRRKEISEKGSLSLKYSTLHDAQRHRARSYDWIDHRQP
ncbi:MAG: hypothetical protein VX974_11715, partial [Pseudomonadota bacterium]|nr:hypothetical protein [Pseudomonadota bacterium]